MPTPQLGYGNTAEVNLDHFNIWMRTQPWYQQLIRSFGQDPNHVHLNEQQKTAVVRAAQAHGAIVDEGKQEVDDSGNFRSQSHKLRNTLIVAGVVGASIATMGAAGVFAGAGGAAAGGASGAAASGAAAGGASAGGALASTAIGSGFIPAIAGGTGLAGGAAAGGAAAAGGTLAATQLGSGAIAPIAGGTSGTSYLANLAQRAGDSRNDGSSALGLTSAELLRYGLPIAGNVVGGLIQSHAESHALDAQQAYLEKALDYQKEQDAYTRQHQQAREAVEAGRYADYEGRIAPYLETGASANDRMATLLGLPASSGYHPLARGSYGPTYAADLGDAPTQFADAMRAAGLDPVAMQGHGRQIADAANRIHPELALDVDPRSDAILYRGQPIDVTIDSGKGGWSFRPSGPANPSYSARLAPAAGAFTPAAPTPAPRMATPALVTVRAPTGQTRQVPQEEVPHWVSRGATVVQEAA